VLQVTRLAALVYFAVTSQASCVGGLGRDVCVVMRALRLPYLVHLCALDEEPLLEGAHMVYVKMDEGRKI